ncbi:MAG TPA: PucR family transcriptional regulator ligand-binding domain-containing protein [Jatrophihabitans sp.]|nr:PucR family transcriptional regulator ligand-binding domain-containing protein [Jatrophihabitans sp.]
MPGPSGDGLTVRDLLATAGLAGTTVLAGQAGLDRVVRGVNVMEVPDILAWVKPDELLLTTAFPLTRGARPGGASGSDSAALLELIRALDGKRLAGLAIKLGRYLDEVPASVLAEADRLGFPVLRMPDGVAFDDVLPDLYGHLLTQQNQVLAQADALHRAISTIVLGGGGLAEIAGEVCRLLDCAVLITTPDGRVLADEGLPKHRAGLAATELFDATGRCMVERLRPGVQPLAGSAPGSAPGATPGIAAMTSIVAGDLDHGRILAYRLANGLLPGAVQALERAAIVAALTITKELAVAAVEGKFRGDYLRDVLTGLVAVDEQVVEHCRSLGWQIDRPMVVVVAELDPIEPVPAGRSAVGSAVSYRSQHERFTSAWQQVMRSRDRAAPVVGFSQEVVALVPVEGGDAEPVVAEIVAAVAGDRGGGRQSFCAGVSRPVADPAGIAAGYAQARKSVAVGRRVHGHGSVSHFDSLGVHRLLSLVPDPAELKSFAGEVLGELAGDSTEAADLRTTLQTLLDTNLNVAETARLLHFHYNTLRYRIGKLERIVGPFTSDANLRLDVALALQVVQMRGI